MVGGRFSDARRIAKSNQHLIFLALRPRTHRLKYCSTHDYMNILRRHLFAIFAFALAGACIRQFTCGTRAGSRFPHPDRESADLHAGIAA
jgi:hypothetical protein